MNQPLAAIEANATASLCWLDHTPPALDEARQGMQLVIRDAERAGDVIAHARALVKKSDAEVIRATRRIGPSGLQLLHHVPPLFLVRRSGQRDRSQPQRSKHRGACLPGGAIR